MKCSARSVRETIMCFIHYTLYFPASRAADFVHLLFQFSQPHRVAPGKLEISSLLLSDVKSVQSRCDPRPPHSPPVYHIQCPSSAHGSPPHQIQIAAASALAYSSPSTTATPASNFFHPTVITAGELHCCYCILTSRSYTSIHHGLSRFRHQAGLRDLLRGCTSVCVCVRITFSQFPRIRFRTT